jgi:hypothetical protein
MWLLYARAPARDAPYWPGRRWLALLDAVTWPALLALILIRLPSDAGVLGPVALALCVLIAVRSCIRALWHNERYRFSTWRLGVPLVALLALGAVLRLAT